MISNVYSTDDDLWTDNVSARSYATPAAARHFESQRSNMSGREKHARYARYSRASRSSHATGGICRRNNRRTS